MRDNVTAVARVIMMIVVAFAIAAITFSLSGYSTGGIVSNAIDAAITGPGAWQNTVRWFVPLALLGTGTVISFRAGYYNVGAQGQFYLGSIAAFVVADNLSGPSWVVQSAAVLAGVIAGAAWSGIAAVLKIFFGTDETLATLMLNFVGVLLLQYMVNGPLKDTSGSGQASQSAPLPEEVRISDTSGVSATIMVITVVALVLVWITLNRTRFGLVATLAGRNAEMVRWQGGNSRRTAITAFVATGVLSGLAGALDILGPDGQLFAGFAPNVGFTAVTVALVGILSVTGAVLAALFFGALTATIQFLPISTNLPPAAFDLLQAVITVLVTARSGSLLRKRIRRSNLARPAKSSSESPASVKSEVA
ncbi:ABC transporter permease [Streptomyces sp. NPDC005921]|uniref:ABC transporter permease n=1 Tax=Streptomyces sp. NPDC005827 TaxID=3157070 RepID=UPI00341123C0